MNEVNWDLIVHRLDEIVSCNQSFKSKLNDIDSKLNKMETISFNVNTLNKWKEQVDEVLPVSDMKNIVEWKSKIDDVVSPPQLKQLIQDIDTLKVFRTKSTMIWVVIQAIVFIVYFLDKSFGIF